MARREPKKRTAGRGRAKVANARRAGARREPTILARGLRADRRKVTARGAASFAGTIQDALHPRFMLDVPLPSRALEVAGDVAVVESEPWPSLFGVIFPAERHWTASGGAAVLAEDTRAGKITIGLPAGAQLRLNGTHPPVTYRNVDDGLTLELDRGDPDAARRALAELVAEFHPNPGLAGFVRDVAARPGPLGPIVALGVLARIWAANVEPRFRAAMVKKVKDGEGINDRVRRWWSEQGSTSWPEVERAALAAVDDLEAEVRHLAASSRSSTKTTSSLRWLHRREDLACVREVVAGAADARLGPALAKLDDLARKHEDVFAGVDVDSDARLGDVRWIHPEAWWARGRDAGRQGSPTHRGTRR